MTRTRLLGVILTILTLTTLTTLATPALAYTYSPFGPTPILSPPADSHSEGFRYPRALQLRHQSNPHDNGVMLGAVQWLTYSDDSHIPIFRSDDEGRSWNTSWSKVYDRANGRGHGSGYHLVSQPTLYELPVAIGDMPAGTILLSALARTWARTGNQSGNTYIDLYKSNNAGRTWQFVSTVAQGGIPQEQATPGPIWEPFMYAYNRGGGTPNRLVVYYTDEREASKSQKLVHQVSTDGKRWGAVVDDVVDAGPDARPGMPVVAKMNNGNYIMTYEYCGGTPQTPGAAGGCAVNYRVTNDPESWNDKPNQVVRQADGTIPKGTPYVVNLPNVGPKGAVVVSGNSLDGLFVNYDNAAPGSRWIKLHSTVARSYSRSFVPMDDGKTIFTVSNVRNGDRSRWTVGNQFLADATGIAQGEWYLVNRSTGGYLQIANDSTAEGAATGQQPTAGWLTEGAKDSGSTSQRWRFEPADNGFYRIRNVNSGKYVDVDGAYVSDDRNILQKSKSTSPSQEWRVVDHGDGYVQLLNHNSGKTFNLNTGYTSISPLKMSQFQDDNYSSQQWRLVRAPAAAASDGGA
ncbi:RICIN domain-containing protein [Microbispora sp. NPDC046933]|uniref:RICIN domain-containing protein n=1 Tax=Microbispora sp. NPDC046933 TaxID=3155618 RepID=UPI0033D3CFB9